jgi:hypothetical protein
MKTGIARATKGKADPNVTRELLVKELEELVKNNHTNHLTGIVVI